MISKLCPIFVIVVIVFLMSITVDSIIRSFSMYVEDGKNQGGLNFLGKRVLVCAIFYIAYSHTCYCLNSVK